MAKEEFSFENFIASVSPDILGYVNDTHEYLLANGCACKVTAATNDLVASYSHVKSKKVIFNYVFRKKGLVIRIYGDHVAAYADRLDQLPDNMTAAIDKAPVCKRMIDPTKCNSRCGMGYAFDLKGKEHKKCRYNCFMFEVKEENYEAIRHMLEWELKERTA